MHGSGGRNVPVCKGKSWMRRMNEVNRSSSLIIASDEQNRPGQNACKMVSCAQVIPNAYLMVMIAPRCRGQRRLSSAAKKCLGWVSRPSRLTIKACARAALRAPLYKFKQIRQGEKRVPP